MPVVKGEFAKLLAPGMMKAFFYAYFTRKPGQSRHTFRNARRRAWKKRLAEVELYEDTIPYFDDEL